MNGKMLRVALIDDEPLALQNMEHILTEFPGVLIVGRYTAGEKALAAVEQDRPDLMFVDIEMPGKNGLELAVELAAGYPQIKVVFVTAYGKYVNAISSVGAADCLLKPVRREKLEKVLAKLKKEN